MRDNRNLFKQHQNYWYNSSEFDPDDIKPHIERHQKIDSLLPHTTSFYAVINFQSYRYDFLGKGQELLTGYENKLVKEKGISFQMENILPEDGDPVVNIGYKKFAELIGECAVEELQDFMLQSNYRFRHKEGHLLHLLEQVWVLKRNTMGHPLIGLVFISELPMINPFRLRMAIKKLRPDNSYVNLFESSYPQDEKEISLSERERETIKLLSKGANSKEIAEELCLSYHTVRTHRKNILRKLSLNSTGELVAWAFTNNLL